MAQGAHLRSNGLLGVCDEGGRVVSGAFCGSGVAASGSTRRWRPGRAGGEGQGLQGPPPVILSRDMMGAPCRPCPAHQAVKNWGRAEPKQRPAWSYCPEFGGSPFPNHLPHAYLLWDCQGGHTGPGSPSTLLSRVTGTCLLSPLLLSLLGANTGHPWTVKGGGLGSRQHFQVS